jgi:hypothetical protein
VGELEAARYRAELEEVHAMRREGGLPVLTGWLTRHLRNAPHPDVSRVELVDERTIVLTTFSGMVATVRVDPAEACSWCGGGGRARVPSLVRPPCEGCMGTGLAGRQRGAVGAPPTRGVSDERADEPPATRPELG